MKKRIDITTWAYIATIIIIYFLGTAMGLAQEVITASNFDSKIAKDISVVEFWADWNKANGVEWINSLDEIRTIAYIDVATDKEAQTKYKIAVIPTIIIFKEGEEAIRFQADLSFKMVATKEEVQEEIDNQLMSDF